MQIILKDADAYNADYLVAVTNQDQDNLVICQIALSHFHVSNTLAMINDPENEEIFAKFNIRGVSPTKLIASCIEQLSAYKTVTSALPIGEGKINANELLLNNTSPVIGKPIKDLNMPKNSIISYIIRNGEPIIPNGNTILNLNDKILLITLPDSYANAIRTLMGDE